VNKKGIIFNFITGSFVDGYGVRTTVFLKGCPLRCIWCCNPEGQEIYPEIKLTTSLCNLCGRCVAACPTGAIRLNPQSEDDRCYIDRNICTNCGKCIELCPTGAIDIFGKYITADELFNLIKKSEIYYRSSNGGVTLGGGEPTFQPDFAYTILQKCKENHINIALDTCGYTKTDLGLKLLMEADLLLYDLKGIDPVEHFQNTGVSNEIILANLKKLDKMRKEIIIRVPIVPGYNDSERNIKSTANLLSQLKSIKRIDLLPYHEYGKVKYKQLGKEYRCRAKPPTIEQMKSIKEFFEEYGLNVQIGG
jgi:pyruvate formate lyase activating enzyme